MKAQLIIEMEGKRTRITNSKVSVFIVFCLLDNSVRFSDANDKCLNETGTYLQHGSILLPILLPVV